MLLFRRHLLFATTNVIAKYLAEVYAIPQVVWARFTFYALFLVLLFRRRLPAALATKRLGLQLVRSVVMICVSTLYFTTLHIMPLADASAVLHMSPLLITAFSVPLLGERVSFRRWLAVAIGFAAVLVVIRPGADVLRLVVIVPLTAVSLQALFEIATRILGRTEPTLTTVALGGNRGGKRRGSLLLVGAAARRLGTHGWVGAVEPRFPVHPDKGL